MKRNIKFGIAYLLTFVSLLFLFSSQATAEEEKEVKPKEVIIKEVPQDKLPKEKRRFKCIPERDIFNTPSCIIV